MILVNIKALHMKIEDFLAQGRTLCCQNANLSDKKDKMSIQLYKVAKRKYSDSSSRFQPKFWTSKKFTLCCERISNLIQQFSLPFCCIVSMGQNYPCRFYLHHVLLLIPLKRWKIEDSLWRWDLTSTNFKQPRGTAKRCFVGSLNCWKEVTRISRYKGQVVQTYSAWIFDCFGEFSMTYREKALYVVNLFPDMPKKGQTTATRLKPSNDWRLLCLVIGLLSKFSTNIDNVRLRG